MRELYIYGVVIIVLILLLILTRDKTIEGKNSRLNTVSIEQMETPIYIK